MRAARFLAVVALFITTIPAFAQRVVKPMPCSPPAEMPISAKANRINILILGDGFTREQCADFIELADQAKASILAEDVYGEYSSYFHFEYYLEPSIDTGVSNLACGPPDQDRPDKPQKKLNTSYSMAYCAIDGNPNTIAPINWDTTPPTAKDWTHVKGQATAIMPGFNVALVLANGFTPAGIANLPEGLAVSPRHPGFGRNIVHEIGHAFGWVSEELSGSEPCPCSEAAPSGGGKCLANVTDLAENASGPPWRVKWHPWYGEDGVAARPLKTGPGSSSCYRSSPACSMRMDVDPYCAVCRQQIVSRIWRKTSAVEPGVVEPPPGNLEGALNTPMFFHLGLVQPAHPLNIKWFVNDTEFDSGKSGFTYKPLFPGSRTIRAEVVDPTPWTKDSMVQRPKHTFSWVVNVPAAAAVTSSGITPQVFTFSMTVPPNTTTVSLKWDVKSQEPGDRDGDRWNILVANAASPDQPLTPLISGVAANSTPITGSRSIAVKASSAEQTIVVRLEVQNGETVDFEETTLQATLSVVNNCGPNCDPCKLDPPAPGCKIPITVNEARLKPFTAYDEFFYKTENNPAFENYNSLPSQEYLSHPRYLWFDLSLPKTWSTLRTVVKALDANGQEIYTVRDTFSRQGPSSDLHPFMQEFKHPYWWRLKVSQEDFNPTDPVPPFIPDEKKTHTIQYRVRFFVTIPDGRVGETETIVSVADPTVAKPLPLIGLYKAPMAPGRFYNSFADMRYVSAGTYKWLQANEGNAARLPQGSQVFGQISGEHALDFSGGSTTGTDVEVNLWSPYAMGRAEVVAAFDPAKPSSRENLINAIATARGRVYELINGDNLVSQVRLPGGAACISNCKDDLPTGYFESLMHTGRMVDLKGRVLDLTTDPRIGTAPWIINTNRIAFDTWRGYFELVLDRCRLGEFGPIYCGTGRPPGTGKNMRIVTQPAGATISPGGFTNLSVFADGPDLLYRWYAGVAGDFSRSEPVDGATTREITVRPSLTTTYWVYVWNNTGNEKSSGATVTVCTPPSISNPPQSQTIDYGTGANLFVTASGGGPLSYRWLDPNGNVVGTSSSIFVNASQTTIYTAEVTNACGVARASATITVLPCLPPILNFQSTPTVSLNPGQSTTLQVIATGSPDLRYRWYANGADTGVITSRYELTPSATSTYHVKVTNDCGTVQSQTFTVNVCVPPSISAQPEPKNIIRGQSAPLTVGVGGSTPMSIVWSAADGSFAGSGAAISVTPNVTTTYTARLSNACGTLNSNPVTVTVCIPPSVSDPQSKTIALGDTTTLSVTATGDAPLSYQWFRDEVAIQDSSSPTLTITPTTTATYRVSVTNACSTTSSVTATITVVCTPASIKVPPKSVSVVEGDSTTLTVVAEGSAPFAYQWYEGAKLLTGETTSSLLVTPSVPTSYTVKVTNACGSVTSDPPATVSISPRCFRPTITAQPQPATITRGQSVELSVSNGGTAPFSYQWFANSTPIGGATQSTYTASPTLTTSYHVVITNDCFTTTSQSALITVEACDAPAISVPPQSAVIESGQSAPLSVTAGGTAPLSYQWFANGSPISGATTASYTASPTVSTTYHVTVSNACGTATSSSAIVTVGVCDAPAISIPPQSVDLTYGQQTTLRVTASGTAPLSYQWYANGSPVSGANGAAYTVTPTATTSYFVVVSNGCGAATSSTAVVTVACVAPVMGLQPKSTTIEAGQSVELTTTSSGLQPFTWQWYANGSPVPFSNGSALTVSPSSTTSYQVVVSNACGTVTSATATVTVVTCIPARVTDGPDDVTIAPGGSTTLSVQTTGSQPRTYEWRTAGGTLIGTGTSVTVNPPATTTYTFEVSNACGSDTETVQVFVVDCPPPVITFQPKSLEVWESNHVVLEVVASSPTPLTYQWYANGELMPGRTTRAIDVSPATVTTSYYVKVTNACGTVQSDTAVITVKPCTKPQITTQPQDVTIVDGESATFSAVASGTGPMTYQLIQQDMTDGGSNTTGVFTVKPPIVAPAIWWYFISVTNGCGFTSTRQVTVTILSACTPPSITTQPQDVTINSGQSATLTVAAGGSTPQTVQWFTTAGEQVGTGTSLTVSPASTTSYYARVSNSCGTQQSATATVTVTEPCTPPAITSPSADAFVFLRFGNTKTLTVVATGTNLQYQWFKRYPITSGFVAIPLANGASLAVSPDDDTDYRLRITNSCGEILSPLFKVRMWEGPEDPPGGGGDPI